MSDGENEEYEVEFIREARVESTSRSKKANLVWKFLVRWKDYSPADDTWEPIESFSGSEHIVEAFWKRVDTGDRDVRDLSQFKVGETFRPVGPPKRPKKQASKSALAVKPSSTGGPSSHKPNSQRSNKRRRSSPEIIELSDSSPKRGRANEPRRSSTLLEAQKVPAKVSTTADKASPLKKRRTRSPSVEIIPDSDEEVELALQQPSSHADSSVQKSPRRNGRGSPSRSRQTADSTGDEQSKSKVPMHQMRKDNPLVKMVDYDPGSMAGAIPTKAYAVDRSNGESLSSKPATRKKPGPGRSSANLMKSSLLTAEKGTLKTVKGKYSKSENAQAESSHVEPMEVSQGDEQRGPPQPPPSAEELLELAGLDSQAAESLPDFDEAEDIQKPTSPPPAQGSVSKEEQKTRTSSDIISSLKMFGDGTLSEPSVTPFAKSTSTIFGPLTIGSNRESSPDQSSPSSRLALNLDASLSIPVFLASSSPPDCFKTVNSTKGTPGKFYGPDGALALLGTVRAVGNSALVIIDNQATEEEKHHFELFCSRLEKGDLFVAMAGLSILVFCSTSNATLSQRLNAPQDLLNKPNKILVSRVDVENYSGYADATANADERRWPPTLATPKSVQPLRKRKRISYKEADGHESDPEAQRAAKKQKKSMDKDGVYHNEEELLAAIPKYPVYTVKPFSELGSRRFSLPTMKTKDGKQVNLLPSNASLGIRPPAKIIPRPLHDPMQDHAIVLYDPTIDDRETDEERKEREKEEAKEREAREAKEKMAGMYNPHKSLKSLLGEGTDKVKYTKVPVVIDPRLSKVLRPHQVEGVKFLYKCTTGMVVENQYGCIMADEMGLGKTLQCITLMWTLLKQSPRPGKPTIEKCIIACPSSLVKNWANELVKWLGPDAINPLAVDGKGTKANLLEAVARWVAARGRNVTQPVMIVSYETLRTLTAYIANCEIGLLLCDEGHRLKNSESQTFQALHGLKVSRRVILTGTPIQNDLSEYFSLLNFANPNFLGTKNDFRKNFENAIIRGRDAMASDQVKAESEKKLKELGGLVMKFIIRRTNDLLSKYLPVKYEQVVFCGLSDFQLALYRLFITSPEIKALLRGQDSQPLKAINILKKLCNHPELLNLPEDLKGSEHLIPEGFSGAGVSARDKGRNPAVRCDWGGKFIVLERFLHHIHTQTDDKIVLISNYTQTLDLFEKLCRNKKYGYFRLDGTMTISKRQKLVDQFNNPQGKEFIFLLSSKAGGCGINLIGANRLILFDPDWNPAADQQALARVWRDGQKKECFVYRFISTGTIEEKIFQRQASKQALSSAVVDEKEDTERHFSLESLRQLFSFNEKTICDTHDTFKCKRCKDGKQMVKAPALLYGDASTWNHFTNPELKNNHDDLLRAEVGLPEVSFVFQYISH
ncbi:hypothetical protein CVT26_015102 [Gymnopilus dilepis]|uniref:DNA repair protein rhp54 n=1 Tax=Gymnopilus dilepis TaxID=231916 RepID=A0A409YEM7_9AGAR|nr:hypothetical protein CVT26_015102 [Gymnopilus dilepis]